MKSMTKVVMTSAIAVGVLAGCQSIPSVTAPAADPVTNDVLQSYDWQLVDAKRSTGQQVSPLFFDKNKPLILSFNQTDSGDRVTFINTCNNMSAEYSVIDGDVKLNNAISTMMACPEPQANFDTATMATVQGKYSLGQNANNTPILTITNANQVAHFKAIEK